MKEQMFSVNAIMDLFSYLIPFLINIFYIFLGILFSRFVKINTVKLLNTVTVFPVKP